MIVEGLVWAMAQLITGVTFLLPDLEIPYSTELLDFAALIGSYVGMLNSVIPVAEAGVFLGWVFAVWLPVYLSFIVARWVWAHLPVIGS